VEVLEVDHVPRFDGVVLVPVEFGEAQVLGFGVARGQQNPGLEGLGRLIEVPLVVEEFDVLALARVDLRTVVLDDVQFHREHGPPTRVARCVDGVRITVAVHSFALVVSRFGRWLWRWDCPRTDPGPGLRTVQAPFGRVIYRERLRRASGGPLRSPAESALFRYASPTDIVPAR
jgi:hypothetical protein